MKNMSEKIKPYIVIQNDTYIDIMNAINEVSKEAYYLKFFEVNEKEITPKNLSFSIIPQINATTRIGEISDRDILMKALTGTKETFEVEKRKKNKKTGKMDKIKIEQSISEYAVDLMKKIKGKQDRLVTKAVTNLDFISNRASMSGRLIASWLFK